MQGAMKSLVKIYAIGGTSISTCLNLLTNVSFESNVIEVINLLLAVLIKSGLVTMYICILAENITNISIFKNN